MYGVVIQVKKTLAESLTNRVCACKGVAVKV